MSNENVINLVKVLAVGHCTCTYPVGSCSMSWDEKTGKSEFKSDPGPKQECLRCKARRVLEADNIEYDKVAKARFSMWL